MRVGITYDLRQDYLAEGHTDEDVAEFDRPETVAAIAETLAELGYEPDRIGHLRSLLARLVRGDGWDLVFNIAEGLRGFGREAQVPAVLDAYGIPYTFSDPLVLSLTLHKGMAKRVFRDLGIATPPFAVVETEEDLEAVALPFPLFVKPVAEGTGKGITAASRIAGPETLGDACRRLLRSFGQPVLVETFLPGREFTVGIVGTGRKAEALGTMEVFLGREAEPEVYSYVNKERSEDLVSYRLASDPTARAAESLALKAWRALGCRDGGRVDLRCDAGGSPQVLEINPLAGLHPEHSDLPIICGLRGIPFRELLRRIMDSACLRLRGRGPTAGKTA